MNLNATIENLLGLSPRTTSIGSCLQLNGSVIFEHGESDIPATQWPGEDYWIMGRELLLYNQVDLRGIPQGHRLKALGQKIRQLSPFERTGQYVFRDGDMAMVWLWDEARRQAAVAEVAGRYSPLEEHFRRLTTIPESVLYPRGQQGARKVVCVDGIEAQAWEDAALVSSQWQEVAGEEFNAEPVNDPWSELKDSDLVHNESFWWRFGMLLLLILVVFQAGNWTGWQASIARLDEEVQTKREEIAALVDLRSQVNKARSDNGYIVAWLSEPSQIATLADFDTFLPATAEINRWEYERGLLEVTISDSNLDNRAYVENLSRGSHFSNVRVEPGISKGTAVISVEVGPK